MGRIVLWLSIISSILIIFFKLFHWNLTEMFTPFLLPFASIIVYGFFLVMVVVSFLALLVKKHWIPFILQLFTLVLLLVVPFNQIAINLDFNINKGKRSQVVTKIQDRTLKPNVSHNPPLIHLPEEYEHLSRGGGDIMIEKKADRYSVLFFTYRGVLDNFSGFVYSPNDQSPQKRSFGGDFKQIEKMDDHWYFVGSY